MTYGCGVELMAFNNKEERNHRMLHKHQQQRLIDFLGEVKLNDEKYRAVLINDGKRDIWIPRSLLEINGDGTFTVPEWFAVDNGIV